MSMPGAELPKGWIQGTLADFVQPRGEKVLPSEMPQATFLGMDHIEAHTSRILGGVPASKMKSAAARFYKGDVLYGRLRPYLNKVATPSFDGLASAEFIVFPDSEVMRSQFLKLRLTASDFVSFASHLNEGDRPRVGFDQIGSFPIQLPPEPEQRRIVAKIEELFSELDKGVESLTTAREQLKAYRQSVLKHAFDGELSAAWRKERRVSRARGAALPRADARDVIPEEELMDLPALPPEWRYARLGEFIERIDAGKSFRCDERVPGPSEVGVAKVSAVTWGEYDEDESKTCKDQEMVNVAYFIKEGDFLFSRANTIELVGACVIVKKVTRKVMLSDKTLRLAFSNVPPRYVLYYLRSRFGRREIMHRSTGNQESMRNIGQDRIRSMIVPVCPPGEAEYILARIQEIFGSVDQLEGDIEAQLSRAEALRQSILRRAFSGRLVAQELADEPASVLLERIRAEEEVGSVKKQRGGKKVAA